MKHTPRPHTRQGSIIIITLVLLLVMTTMGVGLYYSTKQTVEQVTVSGNRSEALYSSETCVAEAVKQLETDGTTSGEPINADMDHVNWVLSGETPAQKNRMSAQKYTCNISLLGTITPKTLYKISSRTTGANNVDSAIEVIVSTIIGGSGQVTYESWRELF